MGQTPSFWRRTVGSMATVLLPDPLWEVVEPLLPSLSSRPKAGRPRISDRACLTGILFVLRSGIPWQMLPQELGCGSGMTCWRRLRDWQEQGIWDLMHFALLSWLAREGDIDWSRAVVDSCSIRAVCGGTQTGPNPTDRAKRGSKRHLICDARGVPLAVRLTGANRNDSQEVLALVDAIPRSVPASTRSLRQTGRYPRGVSLVGMRADLLAGSSKEVAASVGLMTALLLGDFVARINQPTCGRSWR
jgi:transposase